MSQQPNIRGFYDPETFTITYLVVDDETKDCAVIDSVLDYDPNSGRTSTQLADEIIALIQQEKLHLVWLLETHAHADHLSASPYIQQKLGGKIAIGEHILTVQEVFGKVFNAGIEFARDGSQFDHLFKHEEKFQIGHLKGRVIHTPGHTPACITYIIEDCAFVGDTLFMPDYGTARCDFPGGNANTLFQSIKTVLSLPPETKLFMCHDYPDSREPEWQTTVADEKAFNIHVHDGVTEAQFVEMRNRRDKTLDMPRLLLPSVQVNMRAGHLPPAENNGIAYLKIPLNAI